MTHTVVLLVHITAGVSGLLLGVPAVRAAVDGRRTSVTTAYGVAVTVLAATAISLAAMDWTGLWPFAVLAAGTEAAVLGAAWVVRQRYRCWLAWHVRLLCGSYVSLVTALLVVSWGSWVAWVLPIVIGSALVERAAARVTTGAVAGAERRTVSPT